MAYHFKRDELVPEAVRRIAREELESAVDQLGRRRNRSHDEGIHEARKSVKKIRALLRLFQGELGGTYRTESRGLREAGRTGRVVNRQALSEVVANLLLQMKAEFLIQLFFRRLRAEERPPTQDHLVEPALHLHLAGKVDP